jgi:type VI protein secretion system component VasK
MVVTLAALVVLAWIAWAIHVTSDHGAREGLGVLIAWPVIAAVIALISVPFIWAFRVIRASVASRGESGSEEEAEQSEQDGDSGESDSAGAEVTETG